MAHPSSVSPLLLFLLLILFLLPLSCSKKADPDWSRFLPEQTVLVHFDDDEANDSLLADISELTGEPLNAGHIIADSIGVRPTATVLIPEGVDQLSTLWIYSEAQSLDSRLSQAGWVPKGSYSISEGTVRQFERAGQSVAVAQASGYTILSPRSRTIEQALRASRGTTPSLEITNQNGFHINAGEFGRLLAPLAASAHKADLAKSFNGLGVVHVRPTAGETPADLRLEITASPKASSLVKYLLRTTQNPSPPPGVPPGMAMALSWQDPTGSAPHDSLRYAGLPSGSALNAVVEFSAALSPQVTMYLSDAPSGGVAYMRSADVAAVGGILAELYRRGMVDGDGDLFVGRDPALARAICSGMCNLERYAIGLRDDAIVISSDETLTRRLMVADSLSQGLDAMVPRGLGGDGTREGSYGWADVSSVVAAARANGWMASDLDVPGILRRMGSISYRVGSEGGQLVVDIRTSAETTAAPRGELVLAWQYPLRDETLVAPPVATVLNGRSVVVATTNSGRVLALGSGGNLLFEVTTGTQVPVGGVEVYDWYANRSPVVLQAAGAAVYAWSPSGNLLPGFPFVFDATISAPITITDIDGNAEPEIVVPTDDARLHLINRDGRGVAGWPVHTDGVVQKQPIASTVNGAWSVQIATTYASEQYDRRGQRLASRLNLSDVDIPADTLGIQVAPTPFDGTQPFRFGQHPLVADIDGDGYQELIVAIDGQLRCYRLTSSRN